MTFSNILSIAKAPEPWQECFIMFRGIWQGQKSPFFRQNRPKSAIFQWNKVAKEWKWQISSNRPETFSSVIFMSKGTFWKVRQLILWKSLQYERAYYTSLRNKRGTKCAHCFNEVRDLAGFVTEKHKSLVSKQRFLFCHISFPFPPFFHFFVWKVFDTTTHFVEHRLSS